MAVKKNATTKDDKPVDTESVVDEEAPTLLRSEGSVALADVPDNTPTPHKAAHTVPSWKDVGDTPVGYTYVIHPKNGERCLVDAKSVPELLLDGYKPG